MNQQNWQLGVALSLSTAIMWGLLPVSIAPIIGPVDPITITFYRLSGGGALLLALIFYQKRWDVKANFTLENFPYLALAVIMLAGNYYWWLIGLEYTSPSTAQVMIQLAPMMLSLGSIWLFKESFSRKQLIGLIIFFIGLLLFFNVKLTTLFNDLTRYSTGVLYLLVAAITWAIYGLAQKRLLRDFGALELIFIILIFAAMLFLPFSTPNQAFVLDSVMTGLLVFGGINTAVAYGSFTAAMHYWETPRVSAVIAIVPVLTLSFGYLQQWLWPELLPPEPINNLSIFGAIIVVVGTSITALAKNQSKVNTALIE